MIMKNLIRLMWICTAILAVSCSHAPGKRVIASVSGSPEACKEYTSSISTMQQTLEARNASEVNKAFLLSQYEITLSDLRDRCLGNDEQLIQISDCGSLKQINEHVDSRNTSGTISKVNFDFLKSQIRLTSQSLNCK